MSYQVIARKYRPQTFEDVVGQKPIVTTLRNSVEQRRIHHAYLFSGPRGVGKTTVARLLAKALNCAKGPTPQPCNACSSCLEVAQSRSMDVLEIDGASNRGIENIRELRETVRYTPARDRYKVFIIDEVHMLTDPAWNALLKTLEEPPPHVVFIFATTEYREIPLTILSRCQHFEFRKVPPAELLAHLRAVAKGEGVTVEPSALELIGRAAEGSLRDALSALDQVIAFAGTTVTDETARTILGVIDRELIVDFYAALKEKDCGRLVGIVDTVFEKGYQPVEFLEDLMAYGRDLLLACTVRDPQRFLTGTEAEIQALVERGAGFGEDPLLRILELMSREEGRIKSSSHPRFLLEALGIKLARLSDLRSVEELIAALEDSGGAVPATPGPHTGTRPGAGSAPGGTPRAAPPPRPPSPAAGAMPAPTAMSSSSATPAPTATPTPTGSQAEVEALLRKVHDERGAVGGFLGQALWIQAESDTLRIVYSDKQSFIRDKVQSREVSDYLKKASRELLGRDVRLVVETGSPGAFESLGQGAASDVPVRPRAGMLTDAPPSRAAQPGGPQGAMPRATPPLGTITLGPQRSGAAKLDGPARQALVDQAMQEPALRSLLDALGGEIIDIEPA